MSTRNVPGVKGRQGLRIRLTTSPPSVSRLSRICPRMRTETDPVFGTSCFYCKLFKIRTTDKVRKPSNPVDACFENILASIQISVFCDVPRCSLVERFQHFSGTYFIHLRIQRRRPTFLHWKWRNQVPPNHYELNHTWVIYYKTI
jgi:hypothetical protein